MGEDDKKKFSKSSFAENIEEVKEWEDAGADIDDELADAIRENEEFHSKADEYEKQLDEQELREQLRAQRGDEEEEVQADLEDFFNSAYGRGWYAYVDM